MLLAASRLENKIFMKQNGNCTYNGDVDWKGDHGVGDASKELFFFVNVFQREIVNHFNKI